MTLWLNCILAGGVWKIVFQFTFEIASIIHCAVSQAFNVLWEKFVTYQHTFRNELVEISLVVIVTLRTRQHNVNNETLHKVVLQHSLYKIVTLNSCNWNHIPYTSLKCILLVSETFSRFTIPETLYSPINELIPLWTGNNRTCIVVYLARICIKRRVVRVEYLCGSCILWPEH